MTTGVRSAPDPASSAARALAVMDAERGCPALFRLSSTSAVMAAWASRYSRAIFGASDPLNGKNPVQVWPPASYACRSCPPCSPCGASTATADSGDSFAAKVTSMTSIAPELIEPKGVGTASASVKTASGNLRLSKPRALP